jgi:hypothetical protein
MSLVIGVALTFLSAYLCLRSVSGRQIDLAKPDLVLEGPDGVGPLPQVGRLHARSGIYWLVASDRLPGVWWIHLERVREPSINPHFELPTVPPWAEAPPALQAPVLRGPAADVGTLAVGWPWLAVAQQWVETDAAVGFMPPLENDDDGSTTARAADRFGQRTPESQLFIVWSGFIADACLFAVIAAPIIAYLRRRLTRPAHSPDSFSR